MRSTALAGSAQVEAPTDKVVGNISLQGGAGGCPFYDQVDPANGDIYVTQGPCGFNVSVIDGTTNTLLPNVTITQQWQGAAPTGLTLDTANGHLFVADGGMGGPGTATGHNVSVVNPTTNTVIGVVTAGSEPWEMAFDSANGDVYVANDMSNNVTVINGATDGVVTSINVGNSPYGITFDSSNGDLYVANDISNNLTVIDGSTNAVVASIPVGMGPQDTVYDSANGYIYTTSYYDQNVSVVNGATNKVVGAIGVGKEPIGIGLDSANGYLYVANWNAGSVSVINGATDQVVGTDLVQTQPRGVTYDAANGYVYVVNYVSDTVSYILPSSGSSSYPLASVAVSPPSATVQTTKTVTFSATPTCAGGSCSPGTTYAWTQTQPSMGSLSATSGSSITFTAGATAGTDTLFVNATLSGVTKMSSPVPITLSSTTLPTLSSVSISPSSATVQANGTTSFTTTLACSGGGACPSGTSFVWSLTNGAMGSLSSTTASSVTFTAGPRVGNLMIFVNASLNGVTKESQSVITITTQSTGGGTPVGFLGLPGVEGYLLIGVVIAAVGGGVGAFLFLHKRPPRPQRAPLQWPPQSNPTPPSPPSGYPPPQYPPPPPQ